MPLFRKLLAATALVALAAPAVAPAQTVAPRRIVAFGDSYAGHCVTLKSLPAFCKRRALSALA